MRRCLILIGLTGLVTAVLSLREVLQISGGNELIWPAATAAALMGLLLGGIVEILLKRWRPGVPFFSLLLLVIGCSTPAILLLIRGIRHLQYSQTNAVAATLLCGAVPFLLIGALYGLACRIRLRADATQAGSALPCIGIGGALGGGLLFFLLLPHMDSLRIALSIATLDSLAAFAVWRNSLSRPSWGWLLPLPAVLAVAAMVTPYAQALDFLSCTTRSSDGVLRDAKDSPMGRAVLIETAEGTNVYYNGLLTGVPSGREAALRAARISLLSHTLPRRMLWVGGTTADSRTVMHEFPWLTLVLAEVDPALLRISVKKTESAAPPERVVLEDRNDARSLVRESRGQYDVIVLAIRPPTSALMNRLLTRRFFEEARRALAEDGILGIVLLPGAPGPSEHSLVPAAVDESLRSAFAAVSTTRSGDSTYALATGKLTAGFPSPDLWRRRADAWKIPGGRALLRELPVDWKKTSEGRLAGPLVRGAELHPLPYHRTLSARFPALAKEMDVWTGLIAVAAAIGVLAMATAFSTQPERVGTCSMRAVISAAGAGVLMALLLALQALNGHAYSAMTLLMGSVVFGAGLGRGISGSIAAADVGRGATTVFQMAFGIVCAACAPVMAHLSLAHAPVSVVTGVTTAEAFALGLSAGLASGIAVRLAAKPVRARNAAETSILPEMFGSTAGAALAGLLFVPGIGLPLTCMLLSAAVFFALPLPALSLRS